MKIFLHDSGEVKVLLFFEKLFLSQKSWKILFPTEIIMNLKAEASFFNLLRWNDVSRYTSRIFCPKSCNISSVLSASKYNTQAIQITNILLLNNFLSGDIVPFEFKKKATNYCVRFGHSLRSAISLPAQVVKPMHVFPPPSLSRGSP